MTCIVGVVDKISRKIYMGGDSAGCSGWNKRTATEPKVFRNGDMIMGYTTSFRMGQLLQYELKIPEQKPDVDDYKYMCTDFVTEVKKCFKDHEYSEIKNSVPEGGTFLVGYKGNLYKIESDFQVFQTVDGFDACGCGEQYALATMKYMTEAKRISSDTLVGHYYEHVVMEALRIAEYFSAGVGKPFSIITL